MSKIIFWIKNHKLVLILLAVLGYLLLKQSSPIYQTRSTLFSAGESFGTAMSDAVAPAPASFSTKNAVPQSRMVVADSYLSLVVAKVENAHNLIVKKVQELGGFMVSSSVNNPQENANASLTVRVPSSKLPDALVYFKSISTKVVTENLTGDDITNQYTDITARLKTLDQTKVIFEEMLLKATLVPDILNVQRELLSIQDQIDSLKGQTKYLEESATTAKITIYLSTDELSLPYAPLDSWRPAQIAKEAGRSLISLLRTGVGLLIWIGIYGIVWIPALAVYFLVKKRYTKKG